MRPNDTGGHTACAACKLQRKKCDENCVLAPFFPAERKSEFQAVHKVYGVSNVQKMLKRVGEEEKKRTADTLVCEAFWREKDPVNGLYGQYERVWDELNQYKIRDLKATQQRLQQQPIGGGRGGGVGVVCKSSPPTNFIASNVSSDNGITSTNNRTSFGRGINNTNDVALMCNNHVVKWNPPANSGYPPNRVRVLDKAAQVEDLNYLVPFHQNSMNGFNYLTGPTLRFKELQAQSQNGTL